MTQYEVSSRPEGGARRHDAMTQIRLPSPMLKDVHAKADESGLSLAAVVRMLLAQWLEGAPILGESQKDNAAL